MGFLGLRMGAIVCLKAALNLMRTRRGCPKTKRILMKSRDKILEEVRAIEDSVAVTIQRFENGTIDNRAMTYALKEIWSRLRKLTMLSEED